MKIIESDFFYKNRNEMRKLITVKNETLLVKRRDKPIFIVVDYNKYNELLKYKNKM